MDDKPVLATPENEAEAIAVVEETKTIEETIEATTEAVEAEAKKTHGIFGTLFKRKTARKVFTFLLNPFTRIPRLRLSRQRLKP